MKSVRTSQRDTYEVPAVIENSKLVNIDVDYLNSKADHLTQVCDHEVRVARLFTFILLISR